LKPVSASRIFDFLNYQQDFGIERHEIASSEFGNLRRSLFQIIRQLRCDSADQETLDLSYRLQASLSEWLTVPVSFHLSMFKAATNETLGSPDAIQARWGVGIRNLYNMAAHAAENFASTENPMRQTLNSVIGGLCAEGKTFKIYCYRRARPHFESLSPVPLSDNSFLHTTRDYRETEPFDALIKVGPLRSRGWGSVPDAIRSAPRFATLMQVVWAGCGDETDFGYDPVSPPQIPSDGGAPRDNAPSTIRRTPHWSTTVIRSGEDPGADTDYTAENDELSVFATRSNPPESCRAVLLQINKELGILYRPLSRVLSFDPDLNAREPIDVRLPGETLREGMLIIRSVVSDVNLGEAEAGEGSYSQVWKRRLQEELHANADGFCRLLRNEGVNLSSLRQCVRNWAKPTSTVIHAPHHKVHFQVLIQLLVENASTDVHGVPWWQTAWNEVRRSRGDAIKEGFLESEIVQEQLITLLRGLVPQIREQALSRPHFRLAIPSGHEAKGEFLFLKVASIEEGFTVPQDELNNPLALSVIDQWRA